MPFVPEGQDENGGPTMTLPEHCLREMFRP